MIYLRARYYAPADGRFTTRDTWVGNANQPMSYDVWQYANANPISNSDPSGKCAQNEYNCLFELDLFEIKLGGYEPAGLSQWNYQQLKSANEWWDNGIRFSRNSSYSGDKWTADNLSDAIHALDLVKDYLKDKTYSALGTDELRLLKAEAGRSDIGAIGGRTFEPQNIVRLFLIPGQSDRTTEVIIHEIGHVLDWHARPKGSRWGWSVTSSLWASASGWSKDCSGSWMQDALLAQYAPTDYAKTGVGEDFAETFLYEVMGGKLLEKTYVINQDRINALQKAISLLP